MHRQGDKGHRRRGNYLTPGFLDGHIHPESSSLAIRPFAEAVLAHGTTGIMTDLHEVGVVSGLEGIESILKEAEATDLKIYFVVPSHVPFSPNLETSGGRFNPEIIRKALQRPDAVGLSECVGPYILAEFPDLLEAFIDFLFSDEAQQLVAEAYLLPGRSDVQCESRTNLSDIPQPRRTGQR